MNTRVCISFTGIYDIPIPWWRASHQSASARMYITYVPGTYVITLLSYISLVVWNRYIYTISQDTLRIHVYLPEAFAKTKKAMYTNILRPAIDVSFLGAAEDFLGAAPFELKKKGKNFFYHIKSSILKILSKSPRTQIRLLGTPRDFLRSRTTILGG